MTLYGFFFPCKIKKMVYTVLIYNARCSNVKYKAILSYKTNRGYQLGFILNLFNEFNKVNNETA